MESFDYIPLKQKDDLISTLYSYCLDNILIEDFDKYFSNHDLTKAQEILKEIKNRINNENSG